MKFLVAMIIMMNPLGSLSIFLDLTRRMSSKQQVWVARRASVAILVIMLLSVWSGEKILYFLGITIPSFRIAGGLILLLMGLSMLQSQESAVSYTSEDDEAAKERESVAIVPMALPVIIGPGAISTLIIEAGDFPDFATKVWLSILCILLTIGMGLLLFYAVPVAKFVGSSVIKVVTRIMGMIIMAIAVGMLATGMIGIFPGLMH